ncbi:M13 family metallopeptidase [bacterium]|nr:M13 family metallopeptidase [bacterium]
MRRLFFPILFSLTFSTAWGQPASGTGLELNYLDKSTDPSKDFYQFVNGGWLRENPTPPESPEWGRIHELSQQNAQALYSIVVKCSIAHATPGSLEQKIGDFYLSGTEVERLDRQGLQPIKHDLDQIRAIKDLKALEEVVISLHQRGIQPFFNFSSGQDAKDSNQVLGRLSQAGLGLPEQDYYFRSDERSLKQLAAYQAHLNGAFRRLGYGEAESRERAQRVLELEKRLAKASLSHVEMRDPLAIYHPTRLSDFAAGVSGWSWPRYFEGLGLGSGELALTVDSPKYFDAFYQILESSDLGDLRSYLEWNLLRDSYAYLSEDLSKFRWEFYSKTLTGAPVQSSRNGRVLNTIDRLMPQALAQKYVEKNFNPKLKVQVKEMVDLLVGAMDEDISNLTWMTPATRKEAHTKLSSLTFKIGYPERWQDYTALTISKDDYLGNVWRVISYENKRDWAKIGKPQDKGEWYMSAAEVNAYYNPRMNEVVIPAGIIRPPFFSSQDDALNFGGLGTVIGHEITHGFDDEGCKFDGQGNLRDWWTATDRENFEKLAGLVEQQFSSYTVLDGKLSLNGKLVLGESIADLGGLRLAYKAYSKMLQKKPAKTMDGFTPEQRFFMGNARIWATNTRSDYERAQVNLSKHPPGRYRVNGPASNMPEFSKAFSCPPGSPMVRTQSIQIW